jgi:hydrogenase/urease accessory protein HupE
LRFARFFIALLGCSVRAVPLVLVFAVAASAEAHPLAPSMLELRERGAGSFDVEWKVPAAGVPGDAATPVLPGRCRDATPRTTARDALGVRVRWTVECGSAPLVGERIAVEAVGRSGAVVRVVLADGRVAQRLVLPDDPVFVVPAVAGAWTVVRGYLQLGIEHILSGPDHLLFVFGLVLLAGTFRRVAATVTAFTLGHSLTLTLAALVVAPPQAPVEMAIAASVFVLAVELARDPRHPSAMRRRPWLMATTFGLLHGLGFASALADAGLPPDDVPLALFAFNAGIELGQIAFVALVLAARAAFEPAWRRLPAWGHRVPLYAMGSLAAFWWIERTAALFR